MYATNSNEASIRAILQIIHNSVSNASYFWYFLCCLFTNIKTHKDELFTNINRHTKMRDVGLITVYEK